ncbi:MULTISPECIES: FtsH protease activity modulator HflK [Myxococcus]|uniref:FtsH protease activity modulator HflK n=2 Tax=Myxococcaceae TaxID=31 RepID=UPI001144F16A|nr:MULTISPECIES: FtsH protease activity modulator HflK [Myxococcus]NOK02421.1 FtsH protease activity modulator HflK [Myxococcus xanthus]
MSWNPRVMNSDPRGRDPSDVLRELRRQLGPGMGRRLLFAVLGLFLLVGLMTSYAQVEPDEVGVILRLGRFVGTVEPGPHFRVPFWVDRIVKVPVQRQLKAEFGFRTEASRSRVGSAYAAESSDTKRESLMLTGDLNVAVVEWIVQYKIKDPYKYLFKVKNVESMLRDISEASMRAVVGDHSVNEVLTTGRQAVATQAKLLLQDLADRYETGVDIQQVVLQDVNPPDPVKPSFNEVNQAIQEKERVINEAYAELNRVIPRAKGEAEEALRSAEGYAIERVNRAKGEADRFARVYEEYRKAPDVTRRRMYLETVSQVLRSAGQKVVLDESVKGLTPLLNMQATDPAVSGSASQTEGRR